MTEGLQGEGGLEQALGWCGLVGMPRSSAPAPRTCPSPHVRQHLWQRVRHHPAPVLGHGALPHPDAASQGVHPLPPDPQPAAAAPGRVLPARLVLHQRHRHECSEATGLGRGLVVVGWREQGDDGNSLGQPESRSTCRWCQLVPGRTLRGPHLLLLMEPVSQESSHLGAGARPGSRWLCLSFATTPGRSRFPGLTHVRTGRLEQGGGVPRGAQPEEGELEWAPW